MSGREEEAEMEPERTPEAKAPGDDGALNRFGRYHILGELGQGGMGVVYAAFDPALDRKIALKVLKPGQSGKFSTSAEGRLLREAKALARLSHPNVVHV